MNHSPQTRSFTHLFHYAKRKQGSQRRGTIIVLTAALMVTTFAFLALSVDLGYFYLVKTQLQRSADSAALAGAASLYEMSDTVEQNSFYLEPDIAGANTQAQAFAVYNGSGQYEGTQDLTASSFKADVITGQFHVASNRSLPFIPTVESPNTVKADLRLKEGHANGSLTTLFAKVLGIDHVDLEATASATIIHASLLPFATSMDKWNSKRRGL